MNNDKLMEQLRIEIETFQKRITALLLDHVQTNERLLEFRTETFKDRIHKIIMANDDITLTRLIAKTRFIRHPQERHQLLEELIKEGCIATSIYNDSRIYWSTERLSELEDEE